MRYLVIEVVELGEMPFFLKIQLSFFQMKCILECGDYKSGLPQYILSRPNLRHASAHKHIMLVHTMFVVVGV